MIVIKKKRSENEKQCAVKVTVRGHSDTINIPQEQDESIHHLMPDNSVVPLGKANVTICMFVHAANHHGTGELLVERQKKFLNPALKAKSAILLGCFQVIS